MAIPNQERNHHQVVSAGGSAPNVLGKADCQQPKIQGCEKEAKSHKPKSRLRDTYPTEERIGRRLESEL
jgi:hypothetical protein